jgi:hypothetical protein
MVVKMTTPKFIENFQFILLIPFVLYISLNNKLIYQQFIQSYDSIVVALVILLIIHIHVYYHEYLHYFTSRILGYRAKIIITKKVKVCVVKGEIESIHFILISSMPFLFDFFLYLILSSIFPLQTFFTSVFFIYILSSSSGDLFLMMNSLKYIKNKNVRFKYVASGQFKVLT